MGLKVKINYQAVVEYLSQYVDVAKILRDIGEIGDGGGLLAEIREVLDVAGDVSAVVEWLQMAGLDKDQAIEIGSTAIDKLLEFSGTVWGFVPVGAALEAEDKPVARLILEAGYRAIRGTGDRKLPEVDFRAIVKQLIG